jgi:hypothetical protein
VRRAQLDEILREAARVAGRTELVVIGSRAVHAVTDAAPTEVVVSLECDLLFDEGEPSPKLSCASSDQSPRFARTQASTSTSFHQDCRSCRMAGKIVCTCSTPEAQRDAVSRCTISR